MDEKSDLKVEIPDADKLKAMPDEGFAQVVIGALNHYDIKTPGFNFLAKANVATPFKGRFYFFPEDTQSFIAVSLKALEEFDETKKISSATREKFIIEYAKDCLRNMPGQRGPEYNAFCDQVMDHVTRKLNGIENVTSYGSGWSVRFKL